MKKRVFSRRTILGAGASAAALGVISCGKSGVGTIIDGGQVDSGSIDAPCNLLTADNIEGPFFLLEGVPSRTDIVPSGFEGPTILITGRVLDTECNPIREADLFFWQADHKGAYDESGPRFRGHQQTNERGEYFLRTIIPGRYLNGATYRPAHIHVKIWGREVFPTPENPTLTTQLYFPNDPFNDDDPWMLNSLLIDDNGDGTATFDFVIPG